MRATAAALALLLLAGCGSSGSAVERDLHRATEQIRTTHDAKKLRIELRGTLSRLRRDRPSGPAEGRARVLAIRGVQARIDFVDNDRGNIEAATRDALRADRNRAKSARLLRAAERALEGR